eukprot:2022893-Amphidinium_carterae.2
MYEIYGLQKSNSVSAPGVKSPTLPTSGDEPLHFSNHRKFRTAVGKLQWMAAIRPNIQFAVKELNRKLASSTSKDESATKHLIRYLRGTQNLVFTIAPSAWKSSQCIELHAYCDSGWAGCPISKKSTTGVICQLWSNSIVHYSRTQVTVAQSSAEAELYALTSATNDLIHLQSVIIEMGIAKSTDGIKLHVYTDSASSKAMPASQRRASI